MTLVTWQPLEANAWLVVPGAALLQWIALPELDGDGPGMFSQADPAVVHATLSAAGWSDVVVRSVKLALRVGDSPVEAADRLADMGVGRAALAAVPPDEQQPALEAVHEALAPHAGADGVHLGAAVLLTTASNP